MCIKRRRILAALSVVGLIVVVCLHAFHSTISYAKLPLIISPLGQPLVTVEIQGKEYLLEVNVTNRSAVTLRKELLDPLNKEPIGISQLIDGDGTIYEYPTYRMNAVKIGNRTFQDVVVLEIDEERIKSMITYTKANVQGLEDTIFGWIGNGLLSQMNMLIDVRNQIIIEGANKAQLKKEGYNLDHWVKVPFEKTRFGPVLSLGTDFGKMRFSLGIGSYESVIRSAFVANQGSLQEKPLNDVVTSKLIIGNKDFGSLPLQVVDLTSTFSEIDGVLALDFVADHPIYIDNTEQVVFIKESSAFGESQ